MEVNKAKLYVWVVAKTTTTMYDHDIDNGPDEFELEIGGVFSSLEEAEEYVDTEVAEAVRCEDDIHDAWAGKIKEVWYHPQCVPGMWDKRVLYRIEEMAVEVDIPKKITGAISELPGENVFIDRTYSNAAFVDSIESVGEAILKLNEQLSVQGVVYVNDYMFALGLPVKKEWEGREIARLDVESTGIAQIRATYSVDHVETDYGLRPAIGVHLEVP